MQPHHRRAAATSAGVVYPYEYKVSADDRPLEAFAQSEAELEYFRASARSFLTRVVAVWLFATGALCIGAFFATTDTIEKLLCALGATINMVAFLHYMAITKIREGLAVWQLGYGGAEKSESGRIYKSSIEEFQVDSLRFSDWLITMILLTVKLYIIINREYNGNGSVPYDGAHLTATGAAFLAGLMILLGGYTRLGTDDCWDILLNWNNCSTTTLINLSGIAALLGSMACFVILQYDLWTASYGIPERTLLTSLFGAWIGYPIVFVGAMLYRILYVARMGPAASKAFFPPGLSVVKDVLYGLLDAWSKGIFALWTAYTVFGLTLFSAPDAHPYGWAVNGTR